MTPRLPYAERANMTTPELTSFAERGGRFRSRPGAPLAPANAGRRSGLPGDTAAHDADWKATFGRARNVVLPDGSYRAPQTSDESRTAALGASGRPFMPDATGLNLPDMKLDPETATSADIDASYARNVAMFKPGGLAQYRSPISADDHHQSVIDEATAYHRANGLPLPEPMVSNASVGDVGVPNEILRKYQTPGTVARTDYATRLASLSNPAPL